MGPGRAQNNVVIGQIPTNLYLWQNKNLLAQPLDSTKIIFFTCIINFMLGLCTLLKLTKCKLSEHEES